MRIIITLITLLSLPVSIMAEPVIINAVGDIMMAGPNSRIFNRKGYDYPFAATTATLQQADIVIGNLESPIATSGEEFIGKKFRFRSHTAAASALKQAGFSLLSLANNHILDFGPEALQETLDLLDHNEIAYSGAGPNLNSARRETILKAKGKRIAFLSYSLTYPTEFYAGKDHAGTAPGYLPLVKEDIRSARKHADHVVVSFHWGAESAEFPKDYQVNAAHAAIDAGADIILGHHPHVLQGIEHYGKGIIFYSLGNYVFASNSRVADRSIIARITLDNGIKEVEIIPLNVLNREVRFQPQLLEGARGNEVAKKLNRLSEGMNTTVRVVKEHYLVQKQVNQPNTVEISACLP